MTQKTAAKNLAGTFMVLAALLLGLLVIFRGELFSGSDLFFKVYRDPNPLVGYYPWSRLTLESFRSGEFPLWNPYNVLGEPFLARYQPSTLSPLHLPLLLPTFERVAVPYLLARLLIAGLGAFVFLRRQGMGGASSTLGAISFGLTGYLVQYVNNIHVVIDMLLPWLLIVIEKLVKGRKLSDFLLLVLLVSLAILGGQPSAALFTLALAAGYGAWVSIIEQRQLAPLMPLAGAFAASALVCLPQVLPFLEYLPQAWTFHQPGFAGVHIPPAGLITMIAPGFWGPLDQARMQVPLALLAPYLGMTPALLALCALARPRTRSDLFMSLVLVLSLALLAGLPPLSLIINLPGLDRMTFLKYLQPLLAFCLAALAARGAEEVLAGKAGWRAVPAAGLLIGSLAAAAWFYRSARPDLAGVMTGSLVAASVFAVSAAVIAAGLSKRFGAIPSARRRFWAGALLAALVWIELVAVSAVNRPFMFRNPAKEDFEVYRRITEDHPQARAAIEEEVFLSNMGLIAPVVDLGISDVLIVRASLDLFRALTGQDDEEFYREFMKYHSLRLPEPVEWVELKRMLGVRYRLARLDLPRNQSIDRVIAHGLLVAPSPGHSFKTRAELGGELKESLFAHAPCRWEIKLDAERDLEKPGEPHSTQFAAGMDPRVKDLSGDGVWFVALGGEDLPGLEWIRYLDPRTVPAERGWIEARLDRLESSRLVLATLPANDANHDWALWGDLRLDDDRPATPSRELAGIKVYEDEGAWARAWMAGKIVKVEDPATALAEMARQERLEGVAVVAAADLSDELKLDPGDWALELEHGRQKVVAEARTRGGGLFVLADAYHPGWRARVNGEERRIIRANHGLRGVPVPAGVSRIEFIYQPASFRVGLWGAAAAVLMVLAVLLYDRKLS